MTTNGDAHPWKASRSYARWLPWFFIVITDLLVLAWGAMAALFPFALTGPGGAPILVAGYEGYTGQQWLQLVSSAPKTAEFATILFRVYGAYNVAFGGLAVAITLTAFRSGAAWAWWALLIGNTIAFGAAMTYDRIVNAIGPFEALEYVGLLGVYAALFVTAPFRRASTV